MSKISKIQINGGATYDIQDTTYQFEQDGNTLKIGVDGGAKTSVYTPSISSTAENVSGIVAIANGGTGANTASGARSNLGLGSAATYTAATSVGNNSHLPTGAAIQTYVSSQLTSVLKYKGTIGSSGATVTALPAVHEVGDVYVVAAAGTYAGKSVEIGDYIICRTAGTTANNSHWDVINGENQVDNKATSLASAGSSATIATVDGIDITVTTPSAWTGLNKTGTVTSVNVGSTSYSPSNGVISLPAYPTDTNTHRPIQVNGTEVLGNNTTALNLKAGTNVSITNSSGTVTITSTDTNTWRPLGTGANDACAGNDSRLSNSRPASDVHDWAKAPSKPSYSYSEISSTPTKLSQFTNDSGFTTNTGTVTKVTAGAGLTGGNITTTGTIGLATSGVTAGTYKRVTVDAYGRVTAGDNTDANDNTWRKVQLNGTDKLGTATSTNPLNIKAGSNMTITESNGTFTFAATDTTYTSKSAVSGGTDVSLVTTGEKAAWNAKTSNAGTITGIKMNGASKGTSGVVDLGTVITSHQDISGKADKARITAGTAGTSSATSGSSLSVPYVTVNTQGVVTGYGTHTHTITGFLTSHQDISGKQNTISDLSTIRSNATNGNTAYGWGNHANAGYLKGTSSTVAITAATSSSCSITGSSNSGKQQTIIYTNSGTSNLIVTVPTTYKTPDGAAIELTCPGGGYCEVNYLNIGGTIYARGL